MTRFTLPLLYCHQLGTVRAAFGSTRQQVVEELKRDGYKETGLTMLRVLRAYDEQIARG